MNEKQAFKTIVLSLIYKQIEYQNVFNDYFRSFVIEKLLTNCYNVSCYLYVVDTYYNNYTNVIIYDKEILKNFDKNVKNMLRTCRTLRQSIADYCAKSVRLDDDFIEHHDVEVIYKTLHSKMRQCLESIKESAQYQDIKSELIEINETLKKHKDYAIKEYNFMESPSDAKPITPATRLWLMNMHNIKLPNGVEELFSVSDYFDDRDEFPSGDSIDILKCFLRLDLQSCLKACEKAEYTESIEPVIASVLDGIYKKFDDFYEKCTVFQFDYASAMDFIDCCSYWTGSGINDSFNKERGKKFVELLWNYLSPTGDSVTISCNDILNFDFLSIFNIWYDYPLYQKKSVPKTLFHGYEFSSLEDKRWVDLKAEVEKFRTHFEINNKPRDANIRHDLSHLSLLITIDTYPSNKLISPQRENILMTWLSAAKQYINNVFEKRYPGAGTKIDTFIYHSPVNVKASVIRNVAIQGMKDHFMVFHDDDDKARPLVGIINIIDNVLSVPAYKSKIQNPAYPYIFTASDAEHLRGPWAYILIRPTWIENDYCYSPFFMCGEDSVLFSGIHSDDRYKSIPDRFKWYRKLNINSKTYKYGYSYFYLLASNRYSHDQAVEDWDLVWKTSVEGEQYTLDKSKFEKHDHHIDEIIPINVIYETGEQEEVKFWAGIRKHRKVKMEDIPDYNVFNEQLMHEVEYVLHGGRLIYILLVFIKMLAFICLITIIIYFIFRTKLQNKPFNRRFV